MPRGDSSRDFFKCADELRKTQAELEEVTREWNKAVEERERYRKFIVERDMTREFLLWVADKIETGAFT